MPLPAILNLDSFRQNRPWGSRRSRTTDWDALARRLSPRPATRTQSERRRPPTVRLEADLDRLLDELDEEVRRLAKRSDAVLLEALSLG